LSITEQVVLFLSTTRSKNVAAFEDIQCRRSVVSDSLQLLTDQTKQWRNRIDQLEAGQHLDRNEALTSLAQLLDVCQNLRYAILSEDCTANWKTKEELHNIVGRIDDAAVKRRRYLDLAQALGSGTVTHRRERTRQERLRQRDAAVAELMEISGQAAPPDLPGPAINEWLEWACTLEDGTHADDLAQLQKNFPRLDDFVRQLEIELWQGGPAPSAVQDGAPVATKTATEPESFSSVSISEAEPAAETHPNPVHQGPVHSGPVIDGGSSEGSSANEGAIAVEAPPVSAVAVEEPVAEVEAEPVVAVTEPVDVVAEQIVVAEPVAIAEPLALVESVTEAVTSPAPVEKQAVALEENWSAATEGGKLSFFAPDEVGKFERTLEEGKDSRKVQALLAISHWLTPPDQNPVLNATCGMRALIGYTGTSDLLPVSPDQATTAIDSDNGVLLFTGGADLLRWGISQRTDERFAGIASVKRLSQNQIKAWFKELHKVELAEPQVLDMHRLTGGVPMLVGELHRLVIPDPKTPPTWLGFMIWTTVKTNFERRLPVVARELRNGSAGVRLTEREIRVLKMVAIASDNSTASTISSNLKQNWDQYHRPELEALSPADEDSVAVLQGLGLLPMRRDFGLSPIDALLPLGEDDPLRQIVSYL
jgi:hypothetical protein